MQLFYEGKDITKDIEIHKADLTDNAGGELDSLEVQLNDPKGLWSKWKPEKNHTLQVKDSGFDSGVMFADEITQHRGIFTIKALPIKQEAKTPNIKPWDDVRFTEIAQEIASKHGLTLKTYGTKNHLYNRVDQYEQSDLEFLSFRCLLESYALKVSDNKLIIFSESYMEAQSPAKTITLDDVDGDFTYKDRSSSIYGSCKISEYVFKAPNAYGPILKAYNVYTQSLGEAERFTKGLLRSKNKFEKTLSFSIKKDTGLAASNTINAQNFGLADGKYYAYQVIHQFIQEKTTIKLRKPLEGY